ncbi:chromobox homolog 7a isoform X3 [Cyclopterus lumpus]|uniref:chromobox homolog 7a isoform X3 n=1 Tax=Cyclopterus lumpus TaxID=8103 RepID=UPI00148671E0|nr:chromobox homolog 7a isoform X3 [Cyclopterus lumpus]
MELSSVGDQVFAVESIIKKRVRKVQYLGTRGEYFGPAPGPGLRREEKIRALAYRRKGLRPRRLVLRNIFAMDLRSANKVLEKPPPRLRLSLTRSMSTDVDTGERGSLYQRLARRKIKHRVSKRGLEGPSNKTILPLRKTEEPIEEDWCGTSEEEKQESEGTTEEIHEDSLYGESECRSPPLLERQDLVMEMVEKADADLTAVGAQTWGDMPPETRPNQTFARDQSKDSCSVPEAVTEDKVSVGDRSDWDEEGVESGSECPRLESDSTASVIVSAKSSEAAGDCATTEETKEEASGDNQSVTTTTTTAPGSQGAPAAVEHPEKVISTEVTINCLTVTFKEASVAEGFFKDY